MEEYIKEEFIVKNDIYKTLKDDLYCPVCEELMVIPMECSKCQNNYCEKCIKKWKEKGGGCPNRCTSPEFKKVIDKKRMILKIKFKCAKGCGAELFFEDFNNHYNSECFTKKRTGTKMDTEELAKYKEKNKKKKLTYFECK